MLQPDPATRVARFETTPEEFTEVMLQLSKAIYGTVKRQVLWKWLLKWLLLAMAYFLVLAVVIPIGERFGWFLARDVFIVLAAAGIAALITMRYMYVFQKRRLLTTLKTTPWEKSVEVFADEQGLSWVTADQQHHVAWQRVTKVLAFKEGYLFVSGIIGVPIPGRGFESLEVRERFHELAARHVPESAMT